MILFSLFSMIFVYLAYGLKHKIVRTIIYSLRSLDKKSVLSIDLTQHVISEDNQTIQLKLPSGETTLKKWDYINKPKIYDDGKVFFMVCNKQVKREYVFKELLKYALNKIDTRIDFLTSLRHLYQQELAAA